MLLSNCVSVVGTLFVQVAVNGGELRGLYLGIVCGLDQDESLPGLCAGFIRIPNGSFL